MYGRAHKGDLGRPDMACPVVARRSVREAHRTTFDVGESIS